MIAKSRRAHDKLADFPQKGRSRGDRQIANKGAARVGRPQPTSVETTPAPTLALYDSAFLGALKAWMLNELADDPEESAVVEGAFAQLEAEDAALRSQGESVSSETTTRTSGTPNACERGGQE